MLTNQITETMIREVEKSPLWKKLNEGVKKLYEDNNRVPSEEEYQSLRNMLVCKVMLEDKNVKEAIAKATYDELRK